MSIFQGKVLREEPALITGGVQAILGLLLAFGVDLNNEQTGSIMAITAIALAIATRMLVTPTSKAMPVGPSPEQPMYPEDTE